MGMTASNLLLHTGVIDHIRQFAHECAASVFKHAHKFTQVPEHSILIDWNGIQSYIYVGEGILWASIECTMFPPVIILAYISIC